MNWRKATELTSESLREIGLLMLVFAPLDTLLKSGYGNGKDWLIASGIGVFGLILIAIGIVVGSKV
jgi:hypothetical protein